MRIRILTLLLSLITAAVMGSDNCGAATPKYCFSPYPYGGRTVPGPTIPKASYQELVAEYGKQTLYKLLDRSIKILGSCPVFKNDLPAGWSGERKAALVVVESALPIKTVLTDGSRDCDSILYGGGTTQKGCSLLIDYTIENVTDDMRFTSVAVQCEAYLPDITRGNLGQSVTVSLGNVLYDPITASGQPLGPHETEQFQFWYQVSHLSTRLSRAELTKRGVSECHILAARADPMPGLSESAPEPLDLIKKYLNKKELETKIDTLRHEEEEQTELRRKNQPGADACPRIRHSVSIDFAIARVLSPGTDIKRLLDATLQELSRSGLNRAQIKKCAADFGLLLQKLEGCVATGDTECRFSKQESDEFKALN